MTRAGLTAFGLEEKAGALPGLLASFKTTKKTLTQYYFFNLS